MRRDAKFSPFQGNYSDAGQNNSKPPPGSNHHDTTTLFVETAMRPSIRVAPQLLIASLGFPASTMKDNLSIFVPKKDGKKKQCLKPPA